LRLSSFGGYGLALAALALVVFGAIECPPASTIPIPEIFDCSAGRWQLQELDVEVELLVDFRRGHP